MWRNNAGIWSKVWSMELVVWPRCLAICVIGTVLFLASLARFRQTISQIT